MSIDPHMQLKAQELETQKEKYSRGIEKINQLLKLKK
jgi:hypothetical protein